MLILSVLGALVLSTPVQAQSREGIPSFNYWNTSQVYKAKTKKYKSNKRVVRAPARVNAQTGSLSPRQVLPHPSGCPRRLFCGCGASVHVFGHSKRNLWLAANWLKFPRAAPAPGMVAARRGHVFVIDKVLGNGTVMAYDYNSGGGRSHYHARSLAGYTVVNPRG